MTNSIMWFRRDLRLADNHALAAAIEDARDGGGAVIPLFVLDDALWDASGANRRWFLAGCLAELDAALDGGLVVRHGDPVDVVHGAGPPSTTWPGCSGPRTSASTGGAATATSTEALTADGRELVEADSPWTVPPGRLHTGDGGTFKVYSAYLRAWRQQRLAAARAAAELGADGRRRDVRRRARRAGGHRRPARARRGRRPPGARPVPRAAGSTATPRPATTRRADATSRLSPYLRFGCLHPRQLLRRLDGRNPSHDTFAKELAWRDFYADVLDAWPASAWRSWNPKMAGMDDRPGRRRRRAVRRLVRGADRLPDRRRRDAPARRRGVDAQPAADDHGQLPRQGPPPRLDRRAPGSSWTTSSTATCRPTTTAGSGWPAPAPTPRRTSASSTRPASPRSSTPTATYIRRWVPELADLDDRRVHDPSTAPDGPPAGYPPPIVDHATERAESLRRYQAIR